MYQFTTKSYQMDRLSPLLTQFAPQATLYFHGSSCQKTDFCPQQQRAYLHLIESGQGLIRLGAEQLAISEPCLLFIPQGLAHQFAVEPGASLAFHCATLDCGGQAGNPLLNALPDISLIPLQQCPELRAVMCMIWQENQQQQCGHHTAVQRLTEYLLVLLLRWIMTSSPPEQGVLAGLADKKLAPLFNLLHLQPERHWTLELMALETGMSRARFAEHFRAVVGQTPADYLLGWRLSLARKKLLQGAELKQIAPAVGYQSLTSFHRAFKQKLGLSPKEWLQQSQQAA
ncbi:AraC family transcriptional regulator [Rheinheimera marina]|uniref:AraC family transcriptional regulator n=1 Tax=Rheinheimera marina TaxID=1774958 RepID=A0ABV9JP46_9GAMM